MLMILTSQYAAPSYFVGVLNVFSSGINLLVSIRGEEHRIFDYMGKVVNYAEFYIRSEV